MDSKSSQGTGCVRASEGAGFTQRVGIEPDVKCMLTPVETAEPAMRAKFEATFILSEENLKALEPTQPLEEKSQHKSERKTTTRFQIPNAVRHSAESAKGYLYGIIFALCMCMANVLVKMSPSLDGANHAAIRYTIQLTVMIYFIKKNHLEMLGPKAQRNLLCLRGLVGCTAVIIGFFSIKYLDVSDVETVANSCLLITAILARFFLKEKLSICHIFAIFLTIAGVLFIIRPAFLFGVDEHELKKFYNLEANRTASARELVLNSSTPLGLNATAQLHHHYSRNYNNHLNHRLVEVKSHLNRDIMESIFGVFLVIISAICMSTSQVAIRKLCIGKVHFSITSLYPAMVGLPLSVIISIVLILTNASHGVMSEEAEILPIQIAYSFCAGCCGTVALIFLNKALHCEDATKIAMVKTMGVFFSFMLQYLFLDIDADLLGILGALFVLTGTFAVILVKIAEEDLLKSRSFLRILAVKF